MSNNRIILISKDAMGKFYLPVYGNQRWNTPNLDELAAKGTVFHRHYTAAPSSAMSYTGMFTGCFMHETKRKDFVPVHNETFDHLLFEEAHDLGYTCHIIWDIFWMSTAKLFSECYGDHVTFHPLQGLNQKVGAHFPHKGMLQPDEQKTQQALAAVEETLRKIVRQDKVFVWIHFPHVINGRTGYGSDIEVFDQAIGMIRRYFPDDGIYVTADHGNMNGTKGKICYGFDVYDAAACIPLVTPRLEAQREVTFPTSSVDLFDMIFNQRIRRREFVYCDSMYYAQPNRKLAIVKDHYKYIYNARGRKEELYDLDEDSGENMNLIADLFYDVDRHIQTPLREEYYYPDWDAVEHMRGVMRAERVRIWREPTLAERIRGWSMMKAKRVYKSVMKLLRDVKRRL